MDHPDSLGEVDLQDLEQAAIAHVDERQLFLAAQDGARCSLDDGHGPSSVTRASTLGDRELRQSSSLRSAEMPIGLWIRASTLRWP